MQFTPEQLAKAKSAKNAEELLALAKAEGVALTEDEAVRYFAELHKEGDLADDELDNVSGGGCGEKMTQPEPQCESKYKVDSAVWYQDRWYTVGAMVWDQSENAWKYYIYNSTHDMSKNAWVYENKLLDHVPKEYM